MQSQANGKGGSPLNPRLSHGGSPATSRATTFVASEFSQTAAPYYGVQSNTMTHGDSTSVPTGSGSSSNMSGGGSVPGSSDIVAGSWVYPTAQFPGHTSSGYMMSNVQYRPFGPGSSSQNDVRAPSGSAYPSVNQSPSNATNFPPSLPGALAGQNSQGVPPLWRFFDCRVSYADQDEIHLTLVLRRFPSS